jgi:hypothetical protein
MKIEIDSDVLSAVFAAMDRNHDKWWFSIEDCALAWGFERSYFYRRSTSYRISEFLMIPITMPSVGNPSCDGSRYP